MLQKSRITTEPLTMVRVTLSAVALVLLALALMGSADLGSTPPGMRGDWNILVNAPPAVCYGSGRRRFFVTVEA